MKSFYQLLNESDGRRYQAALGDLIRSLKPAVVVESGVEGGASTLHILKALDDNGHGMLHSIDPEPKLELTHPRWTLWREKSITALLKIYPETGPFDIFLHDSDHYVGCQTFEYDLAWKMLKVGGTMVSDDIWWDQPTHHAYDKFWQSRGLKDGRIGCAGILTKPSGNPISKASVQKETWASIRLAHSASVAHGDLRSAAEYSLSKQ